MKDYQLAILMSGIYAQKFTGDYAAEAIALVWLVTAAINFACEKWNSRK